MSQCLTEFCVCFVFSLYSFASFNTALLVFYRRDGMLWDSVLLSLGMEISLNDIYYVDHMVLLPLLREFVLALNIYRFSKSLNTSNYFSFSHFLPFIDMVRRGRFGVHLFCFAIVLSVLRFTASD